MARLAGIMRQRPASGVVKAVNAEAIARVAYELFERRGRAHGHDQEDWFEAERILRQRRQGNGLS